MVKYTNAKHFLMDAYLAMTEFKLLDLVNGFIVVFIKRREDYLQGVNKLDYLLKISVF